MHKCTEQAETLGWTSTLVSLKPKFLRGPHSAAIYAYVRLVLPLSANCYSMLLESTFPPVHYVVEVYVEASHPESEALLLVSLESVFLVDCSKKEIKKRKLARTELEDVSSVKQRKSTADGTTQNSSFILSINQSINQSNNQTCYFRWPM